MEAVYIGKSRGGTWAAISAALAAASIASALLLGPFWVYGFSLAGMVVGFVGLILAANTASLEKPVIFPILMSVLHLLLLALAATLHLMFLAPLNAQARKMPLLQEEYRDPSAIFSLKGPVGWTYRAVPSSLESGVRLQPGDQTRYMGISEVTIFVRRLDSIPTSPLTFLTKAADTFSQRRDGKKLFHLMTEPGQSLGGVPVLFSNLTIKKFWVPLDQTSVFGVKNERYLCSVSATGLKSHATLSRLMCLGLFERISIVDKPGS